MTEELDPTARRLSSERPVPNPAFRGDLRRRLLEHDPSPSGEPQRLHAMIAAYAACGLVLLILAVVGVAGVGPLAA